MKDRQLEPSTYDFPDALHDGGQLRLGLDRRGAFEPPLPKAVADDGYRGGQGLRSPSRSATRLALADSVLVSKARTRSGVSDFRSCRASVASCLGRTLPEAVPFGSRESKRALPSDQGTKYCSDWKAGLSSPSFLWNGKLRIRVVPREKHIAQLGLDLECLEEAIRAPHRDFPTTSVERPLPTG